jgi:hypothetical protein
MSAVLPTSVVAQNIPDNVVELAAIAGRQSN